LNPAYLRAISDAARIVRRRLPPSNSIELQDLVQVGCERVLRYVREGMPPVFAFICARDGMMEESCRWAQKAWVTVPGKLHRGKYAKRVRRGDPPILTGLHEWHRSIPAPDMALLIDIKRTLLTMPLREAVAWHSQHQLDKPAHQLAPEFGVTPTRVVQLAAAANLRLRNVVDPEGEMRPSNTIILSNWKEKHRHDTRQRYSELRRLGASVKMATRGAKSANLYADTVRILQTELRPLAKCGP
jgi:hypothetical protein